MAGYLVYHYNILDRKRIDELGPLSLALLEECEGKLVVGSPVFVLEGEPFTHMVVYRFEKEENAKAFYISSKDGALGRLRREITDGFTVFVPEYKLDN